MPLVSEAQLQSMRTLREENMLFRCDFEEETFVPDGDGGGIESWVPVADLTDIPCSAVAMNGDEGVAAQQLAPASNTFVYVPWRYGAKIKAKYRVVVRGDIDGVEFTETYGIIYTAVPKTFSVQTTIYARSGMAASGSPPAMALARAGAAAAGRNVPMTDEEHLASLGLGNVNPIPPGP
jgi:hypothetical protein